MSTAIYTRISKDHAGQGLGVARQEKACRELADQRGWNSAVVFSDNDVSASRAVRRPQYEAMLAGVRAGTVRRIVVWDLDRLTSNSIELEGFIDLVEKRGVELANVSGEVDLSAAHGRMFARIKGAVARAEAEKSSERLKAMFDQKVGNGENTGKRSYGWELDGSPRDGEADVVREIVCRIGSGEAVAAIARDLNERGVKPMTAEAWRPNAVRAIALRERNVGLRVHRGTVVGKGPWLPLVSDAEHAAAKAVLDDPSRLTHRGVQPKHLLSGFATCAACGSTLRVTSKRGKQSYRCKDNACVSRPMADVDAFVTQLVLARLGQADAADVFTAEAPEDVAGANIATLKQRQSQIVEMIGDGTMEPSVARVTLEKLARQIAALEGQQATATAASAVLAPFTGTTDVAAAWEALAPSARREVVRVLFDSVKLGRTGTGQASLVPVDDVVMTKWAGE